MDYKVFPGFTTKTDAAAGIAEHLFCVFGNLDSTGDVMMPGSLVATLKERGPAGAGKIRVLDNHRGDSVLNVIARPLEIRELSRREMPGEILKAYPEVTGAGWARTQFLMDTPEGSGAFARVRENAVDWSIGYDAVGIDFGNVLDRSGKSVKARLLRSIRLWEYSPVVFAANELAQTLSAKTKRGGAQQLAELDRERAAVEYLLYGGRSREQALREVTRELSDIRRIVATPRG